MTQKSFNFARKFSLPFYFVSAADGTNVVKVTHSCLAQHPVQDSVQSKDLGAAVGAERRKGAGACVWWRVRCW